MTDNFGNAPIFRSKVKTAVLISGRGSNMMALINASHKPDFFAEVSLVISNKDNAPGLNFAIDKKIKTVFLDQKNFSQREDFDRELDRIITNHNCQVVCLAGFMRILSAWFTKKWQGKLINIHPSLLPEFKGASAVRDALEAGAKYSGCTVHFVTEEMDSGPIIKQARVPVLKNDNIETLAARILRKEHLIYPQALDEVCKNILNNKSLE